jgi:hypothetical protein
MLPPSRGVPHCASLQPPADLNYIGRRYVIPDTGWYGEAVDTVRPEAIGVRSMGAAWQATRLCAAGTGSRADTVLDVM